MAHSAENMLRYSLLDLPGKKYSAQDNQLFGQTHFQKMLFAAFFGMLLATEAEAERHL